MHSFIGNESSVNLSDQHRVTEAAVKKHSELKFVKTKQKFLLMLAENNTLPKVIIRKGRGFILYILA